MKEKNAKVRNAYKSVDEVMEHADELYADDALDYLYVTDGGNLNELRDYSWDDVAKCVQLFDDIYGDNVDIRRFYDSVKQDIWEGDRRTDIAIVPFTVSKYDDIADSLKKDGERSQFRIAGKAIGEDRIADYIKTSVIYQMSTTERDQIFYEKEDGKKVGLPYLSRAREVDKRKAKKAQQAEEERLFEEGKALTSKVTREIAAMDWSELYKLPMNAPDKIGKEIDFKSISDEEYDRCEKLFDKLFEPLYKSWEEAGCTDRREEALRMFADSTKIFSESGVTDVFMETGRLCRKQLGIDGDKDEKRKFFERERYAKAYIIHTMLDPEKEISLAIFAQNKSGGHFVPNYNGLETLLTKEPPKPLVEQKEKGEQENMQFLEGETPDVVVDDLSDTIPGVEDEPVLTSREDLEKLKDDIPALAKALVQNQRYVYSHPEADKDMVKSFIDSMKDKSVLRAEVSRLYNEGMTARAKYMEKHYSRASIAKDHKELGVLKHSEYFLERIQAKLADKLCAGTDQGKAAFRLMIWTGCKKRDLNAVIKEKKEELSKDRKMVDPEWDYLDLGENLIAGDKDDFTVELDGKGGFTLKLKPENYDDWDDLAYDTFEESKRFFSLKRIVNDISEEAEGIINNAPKTGTFADIFKEHIDHLKGLNGSVKNREIKENIRALFDLAEQFNEKIIKYEDLAQNNHGRYAWELRKALPEAKAFYDEYIYQLNGWAKKLQISSAGLTKNRSILDEVGLETTVNDAERESDKFISDYKNKPEKNQRLIDKDIKYKEEQLEAYRRKQEAEKKKKEEEEEKKRQEAEEAEKKRKEEEEEKKRQQEAEEKKRQEEEKKKREEENKNKTEASEKPMEFEEGETADIVEGEGEEEEEELQPVDLATLNSLTDDIPALADALIRGQRYALAHPESDQELCVNFMKGLKKNKDELKQEVSKRAVIAMAKRAEYVNDNFSREDIIKKHPELESMKYSLDYMQDIQRRIADKLCYSDEFAATLVLRKTYVKSPAIDVRDFFPYEKQLRNAEIKNDCWSRDWENYVYGKSMLYGHGYKKEYDVEVDEKGDFKLTFVKGKNLEDTVGDQLEYHIDTYKFFKMTMENMAVDSKVLIREINRLLEDGSAIGEYASENIMSLRNLDGDSPKGVIEEAVREIYNNLKGLENKISEEAIRAESLSGKEAKELKEQVKEGNELYTKLQKRVLEWADALKITGKCLDKVRQHSRYSINEIPSDIVIDKDFDKLNDILEAYKKRQEDKEKEAERLAEEEKERQRRQEEEAENKRREEEKKREEEAAARQREKEEKRRQKELEEKQRREEEKRQKELEEQKRRAEEEKRRQQELEEQRRKEAKLKEQRRKEAEEKKRKEEEEKKRQEEEEKKQESNIEKTRKKLRKIDNADTSAAWDIDFNLFENRDKDEFKDMTVSRMNADQVAACLKAYDELFGKESDIKSFCREEKSTWGDGSPLFEYILDDHGYQKDHGRQGYELLGKEASEENISDITKCMVILYLTQKQKTLYYYTEGGKYFELAPLQKSKKWREDEKKHDEEKEKIINDSKQSAAEAAKKVDEIDRSEILDLPINSEKNRDKAFDIKSISEKELKLCSDTFDKIFEPVYAHTREVNKYVGKKEDDYEELFQGITDESFIKEGEGGGFMDRQVLYNMHILCKKDLPGYKDLKSSEQDKIQQKYAKAYILKRMAQKNGGLKLGIPHKAFVINSDEHSEGKHDCILTPVTADHIKKYEEYKKKKAEEYIRRVQKEEQERQERIKELLTDGIKAMDASAAFELPENKTNRIDLADFSTISDEELDRSSEVFEQLLGKDIKISCFYFKDENGKEAKFFDQIKDITKPYYTRGGNNRYTKPADYAKHTQSYGRAVLLHLMTHGKATGLYYRENNGETYELSSFKVPEGFKAQGEDAFSIERICSAAASTKNKKEEKKSEDIVKKEEKTGIRTDAVKTNDNTENYPVKKQEDIKKNDDTLININKDDNRIEIDTVIRTNINDPLIIDPINDIGEEKARTYVNSQSNLFDLRGYMKNELGVVRSNIGSIRKDRRKNLEEDGGTEYRNMVARLNEAADLLDNSKEESLDANHEEVLAALKRLQDAASAYRNSHEPGLLKRLFFKANHGFKHNYGQLRYNAAKKLSVMASDMYQGYFELARKMDKDLSKTAGHCKDNAGRYKSKYNLKDPEAFNSQRYMAIMTCENKMRQMILEAVPKAAPALKYYHKDNDYSGMFQNSAKKNGMKKGMEASCYMAIKELDKFADPKLSIDDAQYIVNSFKKDRFKTRVKELGKRNPRFSECLANHGDRAFDEFDKIRMEAVEREKEQVIDQNDLNQNYDADENIINKKATGKEESVDDLRNQFISELRNNNFLDKNIVIANVASSAEDGDIDKVATEASDYLVHQILIEKSSSDILQEMAENGNQAEIINEMKEAAKKAVKTKCPLTQDDIDENLLYADNLIGNDDLLEDIVKIYRKAHKGKASGKKKRHKDINETVEGVKKRKEELTNEYTRNKEKDASPKMGWSERMKQNSLEQRRLMEEKSKKLDEEINFAPNNMKSNKKLKTNK